MRLKYTPPVSAFVCVFACILFFVLTSCNGLKDDFTQAFGRQNQPLRENVRFNVYNFAGSHKKYYRGPKVVKIGMKPLSDGSTDGFYLDPHRLQSEEEVQLARALFATLCTLDLQTGKPRAQLAESWNITEVDGASTFVFRLRDVYWGDGQALHSEQVRTSLLRLLDPRVKNSYAAALALLVKGAAALYSLPQSASADVIAEAERNVVITAVNAQTLHITTSFGGSASGMDLLTILAHPSTAVLPLVTSGLQDRAMFHLNPDTWVGIGPFIPSKIYLANIPMNNGELADQSPYSQLFLTRRPEFWTKPWLEQMKISFIESEAQRIAMYKNKTLDWVYVGYKLSTQSIHTEPKQNPASTQDTTPSESSDEQFIATVLPQPSQFQDKELNRIELASMIILDIPTQSILRNLGAFPITSEELSLQNLVDYLVKELYVLQDEVANSKIHKSSRIFMPNMVVYPQNLQEKMRAHVQQKFQQVIPQGTQDTTQTTISEQDIAEEFYVEEIEAAARKSELKAQQEIQDSAFATEAALSASIESEENVASSAATDTKVLTLEQFSNAIRQTLARTRGNKAVRIAYSEVFLLPYASLIIQIFNDNNINAELVEILQENTNHNYDIAIRNIINSNDLPIAQLAHLWWLLLQEQDSINYTAFSTQEKKATNTLSTIFIDNLKQGSTTEEYLIALNNIEFEIYKHSRIIPLWILPKQEFKKGLYLVKQN